MQSPSRLSSRRRANMVRGISSSMTVSLRRMRVVDIEMVRCAVHAQRSAPPTLVVWCGDGPTLDHVAAKNVASVTKDSVTFILAARTNATLLRAANNNNRGRPAVNAAGRPGRGLMANDDAVDLRPVLFWSCCCVNEVVPAQCRAIARRGEHINSARYRGNPAGIDQARARCLGARCRSRIGRRCSEQRPASRGGADRVR
jgi:hypothetical protein